MAMTGELFIGAERVATPKTFRAVDPAEDAEIGPDFSVAGEAEVARAAELAAAAFDAFREMSPEDRAAFLERIGEEIMNLGDELVERACQESGLPRGRSEGERGRTVGQMKLFAGVLREGGWMGLRHDPAMPDREPMPRPDLRQRMIALGPVAVCGASNFPLAFSGAGGDTASALAAGCPVIVKGHPAHPGTSELVASAIAAAVKASGLPEGVFSLLHGGKEAGAALVADPRVKAVGFTGSRGGGLALARIAADRPEPIPFYAEMSSVNPVVLCPAALKARAQGLAEGYVGSLTMGAGQFCTNPGLIFAIEGDGLEAFLETAAAKVTESEAQVMLTPGIRRAYVDGVARLADDRRVTMLARGRQGDQANGGAAALFVTQAEDFLADPRLSEEVFGSTGLVVRCRDEAELMKALEGLEGQLTATLHLDDADADFAKRLLPTLERRAGRILANGWPTGVEVCHAMVHGGPFPATSDSRTTSVGSRAIERFLRPVCYQNLPEAVLPEALKDGNPYKAPRLVDGARS